MAKKTQSELIEDLEDRLREISTVISYEAIKPIEAMQKDIRELKKLTSSNDLYRNKVDLTFKSMIWAVTIILGAVIMAVLQLVLRSNSG